MPSFLDQFEQYTRDHDTDVFCFSGRINPYSAREFVDGVLARTKHSKNAALFLCTYGGDPHSAFRMVRCLKKHYGGGNIRLIIDGPCKSAGALIALGVDEIAIGPRGELGPLDTQLTKQDELIFMNSGLDILQALSVVTTNAFDSCFENMIDLVKRSGGSISTKTAADIASSVTAGVFQPITGQIDPLRIGEAHRSMRIAREYGARLKSKLLKAGALDKLVQDYPSHGFVIDKEEAEQYFKKVDDPTAEEMELAGFLSDYVRWPKDEPEVFDVSTFCENVREGIKKQQEQKAQADAAAAKAKASESGTQNAPKDGDSNATGDASDGKAATQDDGRGSSTAEAQSGRSESGLATTPVNGNGEGRI